MPNIRVYPVAFAVLLGGTAFRTCRQRSPIIGTLHGRLAMLGSKQLVQCNECTKMSRNRHKVPFIEANFRTLVCSPSSFPANERKVIALQQPTSDMTVITDTANEVLSFRLGNEEYAISILMIQEIRGYEQPTQIPQAPTSIKGVLSLRGQIVPIVDKR